MKRRDLERRLIEQGCRFVGEGANHAKWRGPDGQPSTIPRHREIKPGIVRAICRQLERAAAAIDQLTPRCSPPAAKRTEFIRQSVHYGWRDAINFKPIDDDPCDPSTSTPTRSGGVSGTSTALKATCAAAASLAISAEADVRGSDCPLMPAFGLEGASEPVRCRMRPRAALRPRMLRLVLSRV